MIPRVYFGNIWSRTIILLVVDFMQFISAGPAWFQICDDKQKYALSSLDCKLGLWMNVTMEANCVCLNGVWILNEDLCDSHAMLLVGTGECFGLTRPIRSIKLLGRPDNPFASATYVADENLDAFVKVPSGKYNNRLDSPTSLVISIYPKKALRRSDHEVCVHQGNKASHRAVHIWKNARRVSSRFKFVDPSKCETTIPYDFHVGFGEAFQESEVLTRDLVEQDCSHKCIAPPAGRNRLGTPLGRGIRRSNIADNQANQAPPSKNNGGSTAKGQSSSLKKAAEGSNGDSQSASSDNTDGSTDDTQSDSQNNNDTSSCENLKGSNNSVQWGGLYKQNQTIEFTGGSKLKQKQLDRKKNWYRFRWELNLPPLSHTREVREQSLRMIQAQTNFLLLNQSPPKINSPEYDYFQKFRQLFIGIVPNDIISHDIVNGLMRMFRVLLWESHDKFQYQENPNPEQYDRIMSKLNACVWNVTAYPFVFTDKIDPNDTVVPRAHSTHPCLEKTVEVYWNDSDQSLAGEGKINFVHSDQNISDLAGGTRENFNACKYDFVIELAWKIYLFGYYRCYEYFEEDATDAHQLATSVQSLFNPRVIKRWYQPEGFNKVLLLLFPKLNFKQFAWAVDKMVVGSRESSEWDSILKRPPIPITEDDIPDSGDKKNSDNDRRKRSGGKIFKRASFWDNHAHCMHSLTDPIKAFKYAGKPGCYVPRTN